MAQSLSKILVHVIFSTKKRQRFIQPEITQELYSYIVGIAKEYDCQIHEIGGISDHLHLLISLPRTLSMSKLIEELKKSSSKWIKLKNFLYKDFAWQNGYGAFSIGESGYENLRKYIQSQEEHHKMISFQDEFRAFLKKYNIEYDEKYVWD